MEKREAPWGLRPGEERGARVDAWRAERGMSRNAAVLLMIDMVLDLPENSKGERLVVRDLPGGGIEFLVHDEGLKAGIRASGVLCGALIDVNPAYRTAKKFAAAEALFGVAVEADE